MYPRIWKILPDTFNRSTRMHTYIRLEDPILTSLSEMPTGGNVNQ